MAICRQKVETVIRMDNTLKYSHKVKNEVDLSISQLIKERIHSNRLNVSYTLDLVPNINSGPGSAVNLGTPSSPKLATLFHNGYHHPVTYSLILILAPTLFQNLIHLANQMLTLQDLTLKTPVQILHMHLNL